MKKKALVIKVYFLLILGSDSEKSFEDLNV